MNPREKKLLALVLIAFLVLVADYLLGALDEFKGGSRVAGRFAEAQQAVTQIQTQTAASPLTPAGRAQLAGASAPIDRDPLDAPAVAGVRTGEQLPFLSCDGIVSIGRKRLVILSGIEYAVGDAIPETGEEVVRISAKSAVLRVPGTGTERTIEYVEPEAADDPGQEIEITVHR